MKKLLLVLVMVVTASALLTSCKSTKGCPAYGKVHEVPAGENC